MTTSVIKWLAENGIDTAYLDPVERWRNGADEGFNGKVQDECLNMECFRSCAEAKIMIKT